MTDFEVRASSVSNYPDCPRRWFARSQPELVTGAGYSLKSVGRHIGAATGQATHQGALSGLRRRIKKEAVDIEELEAVALVTLDAELQSGPVVWDDTSPNADVAEKQVLRQVRTCASQIVAVEQPEYIEPEWRARHAKTSLLVTGHPDMVSYRKLGDIKTGQESNNAAQYGAYGMLSSCAEEVVQIEEIEELYLPRVKMTAPPADVERIAYDLDGCMQLADRTLRNIARDLEAFEKDGAQAVTANTRSVLCSDKFCPCWGTSFCPESTLSKR